MLGNNPVAPTLGGTLTVTAVNGIATFNNVTVSAVGNGYTLVANVANSMLTGATSNPFNVFIPLPATHLSFTQQPTNAVAGNAIAPAVTVSVLDSTNSVVTTDNTDVVTLTIANNPGGGSLSGTVSVTVVNGVATFSNISINRAGTGYTLAASSAKLIGDVSQPFNIAPGPVVQLGIQAPTLTDGCTTMTIVVSALDKSGGTNPTYTGTVTFSSSDPLALLPFNYTFVPADNGVHTFTATLSTVAFQTLTVNDINQPQLFAQAVISVKNANVITNYVTGTDAGGGPEVKMFDGASRALLQDFFAYDPTFTGGVRVGRVMSTATASRTSSRAWPGGGPDIHVLTVKPGN